MTDIDDKPDNRIQTDELTEELSEPMTIGVEAYISEDYARAERDKLWRKVWQQVGRVEEIPEVGNYLTYDILDDSIIVVRTAPDTIRGLPQRVHPSRPPAGRHPPGAKRASARARKFRLRLPRLAIRSRRREHPRPRPGRLEGRADAENTRLAGQGRHLGRLDLDQHGSRLRAACATTSSPPRRCSIRSSSRTCATGGASG